MISTDCDDVDANASRRRSWNLYARHYHEYATAIATSIDPSCGCYSCGDGDDDVYYCFSPLLSHHYSSPYFVVVLCLSCPI